MWTVVAQVRYVGYIESQAVERLLITGEIDAGKKLLILRLSLRRYIKRILLVVRTLP